MLLLVFNNKDIQLLYLKLTTPIQPKINTNVTLRSHVQTDTHAYCGPGVCGLGLEVPFPPEYTMKAQSLAVPLNTSCPHHPHLAFTYGLLKMISAHGGQALAFAFYWKHRDLEQRIYQL